MTDYRIKTLAWLSQSGWDFGKFGLSPTPEDQPILDWIADRVGRGSSAGSVAIEAEGWPVSDLERNGLDAELGSKKAFLRLWRQGGQQSNTGGPAVAAALAAAYPKAGLFSFRVGGVQEFIESARTTEDFWASSYLISHLTWKATLVVVEKYGPDVLIFPSLRGRALTERWLAGQIGVAGGLIPESVDYWGGEFPNGLLAVIPWGDAQGLGREIEDAFHGAWRVIADSVYPKLLDHELIHGQGKIIWDRQVRRRQFETFWGAVEWGNGKNYDATYRELSRLIEARKTLRNFEGAVEPGLKCSQCGKLQSLQVHEGYDARKSRSYWELAAGARGNLLHRFRANERLCSSCVACRLAGRVYFAAEGRYPADGSYPSTSAIAVTPFVDQLLKQQTQLAGPAARFVEATTALRDELGVGPLNVSPYKVTSGASGIWQSLLRFEGDWFYSTTYDGARLKREYGVEPSDATLKGAKNGLREFQAAWRLKKIADPGGYAGLIVADGDNVGEWISGTLGPKGGGAVRHLALSEKLSRIPSEARRIIEGGGMGRVVYSGGDDILALVPAANSLACLDKLAAAVSAPALMGEDFSFSAAVLIFPHSDSLSGAIREASQILRQQAKKRFGKKCVAIGIRRQSGQQTIAALPLGVGSAIESFMHLTNALAGEPGSPAAISGRMVSHFAELVPSLSGEGTEMELESLLFRLLERATCAKADSPEMARHRAATAVAVAAAETMAGPSGEPVASLLLNILLTARFMSRMGEFAG
jgi:CRISPR-associated protein Cmr2